MNLYVYSVRCNMHSDGKWFLFWCDTQRIVFFTPNILGLHVWVGSIQHHRIIFFASNKEFRESQCVKWSKCCDWCWSRTKIVKGIVCVLIVARELSDISFDPKQNQWFLIYYLSTTSVGVDTFHIKYLQTSCRCITYVAKLSTRE
jgi:hypothetical protein